MTAHRQARLLVAATRLLGALPWPVVYALGDGIAALWRLGDARESRLSGFVMAGDWTDTGLPATIEGAVLSGHRAADLVMTVAHGT